MSHYRNDREAQIGDIIAGYVIIYKDDAARTSENKLQVGVLLRIYKTSGICNGVISTALNSIPFAGSAILTPSSRDNAHGSPSVTTVNLKHFLHIEDFIGEFEVFLSKGRKLL